MGTCNIIKHVAKANTDRHFLPPVDFLFQESLLYTSIPLERNVSARISLIWVDTFHRVHNVSFLVEQLNCIQSSMHQSMNFIVGKCHLYIVNCEFIDRSVLII